MTMFSLRTKELVTDVQEARTIKESNLDVIHKKLQDEAEKMVKWKVATEISMKQQERSLCEAEKMINSLKSNLIEQQMSNEHVSQMLIRERQYRVEVDLKLMSTRKVCELMEQNQSQLSGTVGEFVKHKDNLTLSCNEQLQQINEFSEKFNELNIVHTEELGRIRSEAHKHIDDLINENKDMKCDIDILMQEKKSLIHDLDCTTQQHSDVSAKLHLCEDKLQINSERVQHLERDLTNTSSTLNDLQKSSSSKEQELSDAIQKLEEEIKQLKIDLTESRQEFSEAAEAASILERENGALEGSKEELMQQLEILRARKKEKEEELAVNQQHCDDLKREAKEKEKAHGMEVTSFRDQINHYMSVVNVLRDENKVTMVQNDKLQNTVDNWQKDFEEKEKQLNYQIVDKSERIQTLTNELSAINKKVETLVNSEESLKEELKEKKLKVSNLEVDLEMAKSNEVILQEGHQQELQGFQKQIQRDAESYKTFKMKAAEQQLQLEEKLIASDEQLANLKQNIFDMEKDTHQILIEKQDTLKELDREKEVLQATKVNLQKEIECMAKEIDELKLQVTEERNKSLSLSENTDKIHSESDALKEKLNSIHTLMEEKQKEFNELLVNKNSEIQVLKKGQNVLDKKVKAAQKNSTSEGKKSEQLRSKVSNLQDETKTLKGDLKEAQMEAQKLQQQLTNTQQRVQEFKDKSESLSCQEVALKQELNECQAVLACERKEANQNKMQVEGKMQEMIDLLGTSKKEQQTILDAKEAENLQLQEQIQHLQLQMRQQDIHVEELGKQLESLKLTHTEEMSNVRRQLKKTVKEYKEFQDAIRNFASPQPPIHSSSRTPSPSKYFALDKNMTKKTLPVTSTPTTPNDWEMFSDNIQMSQPNNYNKCIAQPLPVNNENNEKLPCGPKKNVTFKSPLYRKTRDSDSSDAYAFEISDMDEPFEIIRRTGRNVGRNIRIPQANVTPMTRVNTYSATPRPKATIKRAKMDTTETEK